MKPFSHHADESVFAMISLADLQDEIARQRLDIHPAMAPLYQPQADGWGTWTAGGVGAALRDLGIPAHDFCCAIGLDGLRQWLDEDLGQRSLEPEKQEQVTGWMTANGWRPVWTWAGICRVGSSLGIPEETLVLDFDLEWPDVWQGSVPSEASEAIERYFRVAGWLGPHGPRRTK